jgi:TPR repeat protein
MVIEIPFELKRAIERNELIIFVGSGLSSKLKFPTWKTLLLNILDAIISEGNNADLKSKYEAYSNNPGLLSDKEIIQSLLKVLEPFNEKAKKLLSIILDDRNKDIDEQKITEEKLTLHKKLWSLTNNIITTNYDQVLETANNRCEVILNENKYLQNNFNPDSYNLFKIHGTIEDPNSCVLFDDEYKELYNTENENLSLFTLRSILKNYVILFIGFSMDDPYIETVMKVMNDLCGSSAKPNYIITKTELEGAKELNLIPLLINEYSEIDNYIDELIDIRPKKYVGSSIRHYDNELFGRDDEIKVLTDFINDNNCHFFLLYGLGGIGKSHLVYKTIETTNSKSIIIYGSISSSFNKIAAESGIRIDHLTDKEERKNFFINEINNRSPFLIIDDFYNIYDEEFLNILPELTRISAGKLMLISWAIPDKIKSASYIYERLHLGLLKKEHYFAILDSISERLFRSTLNHEIKEAIYNKTAGHPLSAQFIIPILSLPGTLADKMNSLPDFDPIVDVEGTLFSKKLLGVLFNTANNNEVNLLSQFSAFNEPVNKDLIALLPAYDHITYLNLLNKDLIWQIETETIKLHTLVKLFMYDRLGDKNEIHLILGKYYEKIAIDSNLEDIHSFEVANYHYIQAGGKDLELFETNLLQLFRSKHVKELITDNKQKTIERLFLGIKKMPDFLPYYNELGMVYRNMKDYPNAVLYLKQAAEKGNLHSFNELGITYREMKDYPNAVLYLKPVADKGIVQCINELGITYREMKDYPNAVLYLKQAADKGNVYSMNVLGITYREMKDYTNAVLYLKQAADKGHIPSSNELGITYREMKDYTNAVFYLKPAADKGNLPSTNELGITYREMKDYPNAVFYLKLAADKGNVQCINELGITYREMKDYTNAVFYLKPAADKGHIPSSNELGITYREMKDYTNAVFYLKQAADKGNIYSISELAITYNEEGNPNLAIDTLEKGLIENPGNVQFLTKLSNFYQKEGNIDKAIEKLLECLDADNDNEFAVSLLSSIYQAKGIYSARENMLFKVYAKNKQNSYINLQLMNVFDRYRKYRVSLQILEQTKNKNLNICMQLMNSYFFIGDIDAYNKIRIEGEKLYHSEKNIFLKNRFGDYLLKSFKVSTLVGSIYNTGIFCIINGIKKIQHHEHVYELVNEMHLNNKIKEDDKVFFALYKIDGKEVADYIEPYFDNLDDLRKLK